MIPWFQFTTIHLGPIPIQVWGLFVALGMLLTLRILWKRAQAGEREKLLDQALWMIVGGIIMARLFHVFFYEPAWYWSHPYEIFKLWHGGLSSFGGIVGAVFGFVFYELKTPLKLPPTSGEKIREETNKKIFLLQKSDLLSYAALFGWLVGRVGCFMIHDHLGVNSNCPLAIQTPNGPRLEMALLEILGLIPLAVFFFIFRKRQLPVGWQTSILFIYYGLLRFILDFYRAYDARYLGLTPAQYFAILFVFAGVYWLARWQNHSRQSGEFA